MFSKYLLNFYTNCICLSLSICGSIINVAYVLAD